MKKILSIILAFAIGSSIANAQTVENSKLFENTSVSVYGGAITTTHFMGEPVFWGGLKNVVKGVRPLAGIEFTKYVTPVVGFSIEGLAMFGTTGSNTFVDQSNVVGNLKFNLTNSANGYKGSPKTVEIVLVPGLGWGHDYGDVYHDRNYLTYNIGAELNINLGEKKAWQINVKPVVMFNNYNNALMPVKGNMQARLQVGVTYKFESKQKKSHNFVLCPYSVRKEDYNGLQRKYDIVSAQKSYLDSLATANSEEINEMKVKIAELESREPQVVEKTVELHDVAVYFNKGQYTISERELLHLDFFAQNVDKSTKLNITGSADSATGSNERNAFLAEQRALAVKKALVEKYGFDENNISIDVVKDMFNTSVGSRVAVVE